MKLGRIHRDSPDGKVARLVAAHPDEDRVVDLAAAEQLRLTRAGSTSAAARRIAAALFPESMSQAIAAGPAFLDAAERADEAAGRDASLPIADVEWIAALDPPVIRDSLTFPLHMKQYGEALNVGPPNPQFFRTPGYFKGSTGTVFGHDEVIPYPAFAEKIDYELELGFVVGGEGRNLTPDQAGELLFGLTIFNDFSARDIQAREMGMGMGPQKCKDFAFGIGPWITTIGDPGLPPLDQLTMRVRVNGEEWATGVSEGMIYSAQELLAYVSVGDVLQPGDIIGSGTVGNGSALELGRHLVPGDVVELEVDGVGVLRNRFSAEPDQHPWWPEPRENPFETEAAVS
ncbi:MAG: fumarylacetoacetate hydrolase family protein [Solirubrobacteraceae bacterium]